MPADLVEVGHEQAVVAPGVAAAGRAGGVVAEAVCFNPFRMQGLVHVPDRGGQFCHVVVLPLSCGAWAAGVLGVDAAEGRGGAKHTLLSFQKTVKLQPRK